MKRAHWTVITLAAGLGSNLDGGRTSSAQMGCEVMLEAELATPDSMILRAAQTDCESVKLVVIGPARRTSAADPWSFSSVHEIPVALENTGRTPINLPIPMSVDSVAPVQRGRQLTALFASNYVAFPYWSGREAQQPWRFQGLQGGKETKLLPGTQTSPERLLVGTWPLTQGFRVWLRISGVQPRVPAPPGPPPLRVVSPPEIALADSAVRQLAGTARLPQQRAIRALYRDPARHLLIFDVEYGTGQDCLAGCFYSHAIGMSYGAKIGWVHLDDYEREAPPGAAERVQQALLPIDETDTYLLSGQLLDTLGILFGGQSWLVDQVILPPVVRNPHVQRELLVRLVEHLYASINPSRAALLVQCPAVKDDTSLLTLLADLPNEAYETARTGARESVMKLGRQIVSDPAASTRTLFVLAQTVFGSRSALRNAVLVHPKVRNNAAILAIFEDGNPELQPQLLAAVSAPARVKSMLADYLTHRWTRPDSSIGWTLLRDPEAGQNRDVLSVLANLSVSNDQGLVWAASRRLPEGSLRRWEPDYVPMH